LADDTVAPPERPSNVTPIGKLPARLLPEMQIRWLMSNMDKVKALAVVVDMEGQNPLVSVSTGSSPYFLSLGASILDREAIKALPSKK